VWRYRDVTRRMPAPRKSTTAHEAQYCPVNLMVFVATTSRVGVGG
jgi:hypothetical protein